jgi:dolichol kinase
VSATGTSRAGSLRAEVLRKALHLATAAVPVAWGLGLVETHTVRATLVCAALVALAIELLRFTSPAVARGFESTFGSLLRAHEHRAITGATWLAVGMATVAWMFPPRAAVIALWAAAVGDATAALAGRAIAHARHSATTRKTLGGSLAAALSTAAGAIWLVHAPLWSATALGAVAAAAEWPARPLDDNVRIVGAVALAAVVLGLR